MSLLNTPIKPLWCSGESKWTCRVITLLHSSLAVATYNSSHVADVQTAVAILAHVNHPWPNEEGGPVFFISPGLTDTWDHLYIQQVKSSVILWCSNILLQSDFVLILYVFMPALIYFLFHNLHPWVHVILAIGCESNCPYRGHYDIPVQSNPINSFLIKTGLVLNEQFVHSLHDVQLR